MTNPHDALFRATFGDPQHARALLRSALPAWLAAAIDWPTLRVLDASFVDPELADHRGDLLFGVDAFGWMLYLYVVVEHRSTDERFLTLDMLRYVVRILERHREAHPGETKLPPVIPLVVHHGDRPMRAARSLQDLVELESCPPAWRDSLLAAQPGLRIFVDDLASQSEAALRGRALTATGLLSLFCLQFVRGKGEDDALAALARVTGLIREVLDAGNGQDAVLRLLSWLRMVTPLDNERLRPILRLAGPDAEELMISGAEKLRAEGRAEGRAEERRSFVQKLVTRRFGPLPPPKEARLLAASPDELERFALRLLEAKSLDDVFAD